MPIVSRAADAARLLIERLGPLDQTKLQKLLYYSQALSLVWFKDPLFPEKIEAWVNGPVVADFWRDHKYESTLYSIPEASAPPDPKARARAERIIEEVLRAYGALTGGQLSQMSHGEEPWKSARNGMPANERSTAEIDRELMRTYYSHKWSRRED